MHLSPVSTPFAPVAGPLARAFDRFGSGAAPFGPLVGSYCSLGLWAAGLCLLAVASCDSFGVDLFCGYVILKRKSQKSTTNRFSPWGKFEKLLNFQVMLSTVPMLVGGGGILFIRGCCS